MKIWAFSRGGQWFFPLPLNKGIGLLKGAIAPWGLRPQPLLQKSKGEGDSRGEVDKQPAVRADREGLSPRYGIPELS